jgi:hypothetical protein
LEVINTVLPSLKFDNVHEPLYKKLKDSLPKHKSNYAAGKNIMVQYENKTDLSILPLPHPFVRSQNQWRCDQHSLCLLDLLGCLGMFSAFIVEAGAHARPKAVFPMNATDLTQRFA